MAESMVNEATCRTLLQVARNYEAMADYTEMAARQLGGQERGVG
jgi:hypothetical protein